MQGWGGKAVAFAAVVGAIAGCGEVEKAKTKAREAVVQEVILEALDDDSSFKGRVTNSPLGLSKYEGRVSVVSIGNVRSSGRKIEIKSGTSTIDLSPDSVNTLQGVGIAVYRWTNEEEIPIVNPKEPPPSGAFAVVAYSEVRRDSLKTDGNHDWYTYRTTEGTLRLSVVDASENGGVRGEVDFWVLLLDPNRPPATSDDMPLVRFQGEFNVRKSSASTLYTGK